MSETYKGMTIPQYSDTADGVAAIRNLVDSGPIPRVDGAGLNAIADTDPPVGVLAYYTEENVILQWCGPVQAWKPPWKHPWGLMAHWKATTSSTHSSPWTTVSGFANLEWTAYPDRFYRVTVTGLIEWIDEGTSQGLPDWSVDGKIARAAVQIQRNSDSSQVMQAYNGRGGFMYGYDSDLFSSTMLIEGLSGAQSWKVVAGTLNNQTTDDFTITFGASMPLTVFVEDIGPSGAPT